MPGGPAGEGRSVPLRFTPSLPLLPGHHLSAARNLPQFPRKGQFGFRGGFTTPTHAGDVQNLLSSLPGRPDEGAPPSTVSQPSGGRGGQGDMRLPSFWPLNSFTSHLLLLGQSPRAIREAKTLAGKQEGSPSSPIAVPPSWGEAPGHQGIPVR